MSDYKELEAALEKAGVGDISVVLVYGKPRLVLPSDQHDEFTGHYSLHFEKRWAKNQWGFCRATTKIHLRNGRSRDPDLSYWGYPRCHRDADGILVRNGGAIVPDVVIQFSWKNTQKYEEDAINDMMNRALEERGGVLSATRPTLGYLIKVKFSRKRPFRGLETQDMQGLDVYRLPHGTDVDDARDPNNPNAQHLHYTPGGPEVYITITPRDLGILVYGHSRAVITR